MNLAAPILKLDDIVILSKRDPPEIQCCHAYGILKDKVTAKGEFWHLFDDTCRDIGIKLCGNLENYPIPIPGDIVRIHRLSFDRITRGPVILSGKNVVIWRGFRENPTPITKAQSPTYTETDTKRRKELEIYHESTIITANLIAQQAQGFFTIAGQIHELSADRWGNNLIKFIDGTGSFILRVFPKRNEIESNIHYENAAKLCSGDFMIATSVCLDRSTSSMVNLSANVKNGRYICKVEPNSYLGRKLTLAIGEAPAILVNQAQKRPQPESPSTRPVRRSPRLNAQVNGSPTSLVVDEDPQLPEYTKTHDIPMTGPNSQYRFYDLAGQVRGTPNETSNFGNWVFQLYDGSRPGYSSYYVEEVKDREPDCVTILVFSKQTQQDTDQHIETVKRLKSGDLIFVKNVRATWKGDKLRLEMSANLAHGKSITVIDKSTKFGQMLDDIVCNPITPNESFHDATLDTSVDSDVISQQNPDD